MRSTFLPLCLIILLAVFLRFFDIDQNPKALYGDGVTLVYDAYSILKTGHDQKGQFLPLVFSLGAARPPGYVYATIPFVALFGPTQVSAMMVSLLSGIGVVILVFLLGKMFFSGNVGLLAAAAAAVNPWELSLSRGPFETHFALFLTLLGIYCFFKGLKNHYYFLIFGLAFALSMQTYPTYRLSVPLLSLWLLIWNRNYRLLLNLKKPILLFSLIIIVSSSALGLYLTFSRGIHDRFTNINIFINPELRNFISGRIQSDRLFDSLSPTISYKLHTPKIELVEIFAENYLSNFFPNFLFLHGDGSPRHNPAEMGQFFWTDAFLILLGIIYAQKHQRGILILLFGWMLIAPIATSLVEDPHALRNSLMLIPFLLLIGLGAQRLWESCKNRASLIIMKFLIILFAIQLLFFFDRFYFVAPQKNAEFWSYAAKKATLLAQKNQQKFDMVILSNDIDNMEFAYPFYAKIDPNLVIRQNQSPTKIGDYSFFQYGNIYIGSLPSGVLEKFLGNLSGSVLYVGSNKEQPFLENYQIIRGFDNQPELIIKSISQTADLDLK